jgi:MtfA peptidase
MLFGSKRLKIRRRALEQPFPDAWRSMLERRWPAITLLSPDERRRHEALTLDFVAARSWEGARGFEITPEMQALVAAQACLLILGLHDVDDPVDDDPFARSGPVILHPRPITLSGTHGTEVGDVVETGPRRVSGEAHHRGPVLLSWSTVQAEARFPQRGHNVVMHEFAHHLDMDDGTVDGTPRIVPDELRRSWVRVCTREFRNVRRRDRRGEPEGVLRSYAGVDPGEFFAVATEAFFTRPRVLAAEIPDLYDLLCAGYRQDPALRLATSSAAG